MMSNIFAIVTIQKFHCLHYRRMLKGMLQYKELNKYLLFYNLIVIINVYAIRFTGIFHFLIAINIQKNHDGNTNNRQSLFHSV